MRLVGQGLLVVAKGLLIMWHLLNGLPISLLPNPIRCNTMFSEFTRVSFERQNRGRSVSDAISFCHYGLNI
uniref:Putative secreted protein n=1 Tax=Ixodes ricinus TaxID=34613 RepID=A0A6B0U9J5_IXORI